MARTDIYMETHAGWLWQPSGQVSMDWCLDWTRDNLASVTVAMSANAQTTVVKDTSVTWVEKIGIGGKPNFESVSVAACF